MGTRTRCLFSLFKRSLKLQRGASSWSLRWNYFLLRKTTVPKETTWILEIRNHKQFYTLYFEKGNQSLNQSLLQVSSVTDYLYSKYTSHNSQMCICRVKISGNQSLCNRKTCGSDRHLADCNHKPCKNTVNNTVSQHSWGFQRLMTHIPDVWRN